MGLSEEMSAALAAFASEVGEVGPVAVIGSGSRPTLGGSLEPGTRLLSAPSGIIEHSRSELTVCATAATTVAELESVLNQAGQTSGLDPGLPGSTTTLGSAIATATGGLHGLAQGPMRDLVLGISGVDAAGRVLHVGGATVKNVSGFDLCRLFTGSLGTLALFGAVTLRTIPLPHRNMWFHTDCDPFALVSAERNATCVLWDGESAWVHLAGREADLVAAAGRIAASATVEEVPGPPDRPPHRWSIDPATLPDWRTDAPMPHGWLAEVGVGIVHAAVQQPPRPLSAGVVELNRAVKERFDPLGRLAPGRSVLGPGVTGSPSGVAS